MFLEGCNIEWNNQSEAFWNLNLSKIMSLKNERLRLISKAQVKKKNDCKPKFAVAAKALLIFWFQRQHWNEYNSFMFQL